MEEGVNAVRASNWQGKSSLVAAIEAAIGADTSLTEGRSHGRVVLEGPERYEVELRREGEEVVLTGEPYLVDQRDRVCAELFAFLDESNPVRRAVREGERLDPVLTRPLDLEDIDEQIAELKAEREAIQRELEGARDDAGRLPGLEKQVNAVESEISALRERRDALRDEVGDADRIDDLADLKAERAQVADLIDRLEGAIDRTSEKLGERYAELEDLVVRDASDVEAELAETREAIREGARDVELLQSIYSAQRRLLEENRVGLLDDVDHGLLDDEFSCWTCGETTNRESIERRIDGLGDRIQEIESELAESRERLDELEGEREEAAASRRRKRDLEDRISNLETTLADREESLGSARERAGELDRRIEAAADADVATTEELTDVESEIKYKENELTDLTEELEACSASAEREETLVTELETICEELEALRTRKERVRREMRESFDRALSEVVQRFDTGFESARLTADFELEVARDGRAVERNALSEGELELLGFVVAIAGHETYDVAETVPFMLLDRLGGLADENLHRLVEYLEDRCEYLVLTAMPEHTTFDGAEIDPKDWAVVSREQEATTV